MRSNVDACANRGVNATPSRKANSTCTPVCATRTSWSSSIRLRSQRSSSVSRPPFCSTSFMARPYPTGASSKRGTRSAPPVGQLEVELPVRALLARLPGTLDRLALAGERAPVALGEAQRREVGLGPLERPHAVLERHRVHAHDAAGVEVVLRVAVAVLVRGKDAKAVGGRVGRLHALHDERSAERRLEAAGPVDPWWGDRRLEGPVADQRLQAGDGGLQVGRHDCPKDVSRTACTTGGRLESRPPGMRAGGPMRYRCRLWWCRLW